MRIKRFLLLMSILLLLGSLLVACSEESTGGVENTTDENETIDERETTLRFTIWFGEGDIEIWEQVIEDFENEYPNISVEFEPSEFGDYFTRLQTQLAAGSAPDVIGMHVGIVFDYADRGQLAALDSFIEGSPHNINDIPDSLIEEGGWPIENPNQYALPWRFAAAGLYANKTAFEEAGVEFPTEGWTIEEFEEAAQQLTTDDRYAFEIPTGTMSANLLAGFGGSAVTEDRLNSAFDQPEVLEYYEWTHDLVFQAGVAIHPKDVDESIDPFLSQQVAMKYAGSWMIPVYRDIEDFEWDILPNPTINGNSKTYSGPDMISMNEASEHKEEAWKFIEYAVFHDEAQALLGTTGLPVREQDLLDENLIAQMSELGPENYQIMVEGAAESGTGYGFTTKFVEIGDMVGDASYLIYDNENTDIQQILEDLHQQVEDEFQR